MAPHQEPLNVSSGDVQLYGWVQARSAWSFPISLYSNVFSGP